MDTIAFRHATADLGTDEGVAVVEIVINGRVLSDLWAAATNGDEALPIPDGADLWRAGATPDEWYWEHGRTAVLTCSCGTFGCGGASAKIGFAQTAVTWSDFHHANGGERVDLGPFTFDRADYDAALARLAN